MESQNQTNEAHLHKMFTITATIDKVEQPDSSKFGKIYFEEFPKEPYYFFQGSLNNITKGSLVTYGILDFYIGKSYFENLFQEESGRGILLFNINDSECFESSARHSNNIISLRNYKAEPNKTVLAAGTRACAPSKFFNGRNLVKFNSNGYSYYPLVTFADDSPFGSCYLSYYKCEEEDVAFIESKPLDYIFGINDYPEVDTDIDVLIHKKIY